MDFNQILLFAGLGLLVIVLLFALWGFLGGLKRELRCVAVFIVLLVLSWLVFGDQATLLNVKAGQRVAEILGVQDDSISTIWDAILVYARSVVPNGEDLLVEGKETYTLFYSVVGTIFRAVGLLAGTVVVLIISPIIRLITHMIELIIRAAKQKKPIEQAASETAVSEKEQVLISTGEESVEEAVVTKEANELVKKPAGKKRWWGALAGSLKGVFVVILVCVPLSGICTVLNTATPETRGMISDLVNGKEQQTTSTDDPIEMIFDFAKAYDESGLGKFANASSYFFGKSFSESLFDDLLRIETKNQNISVSEELITFIKAANALNGKSNPEKWSIEELQNALNALKKSKLLVEGMPVAIEYGYEIPVIQEALNNAYQDSDYLSLRYINWGKDLDAILDAVVEAYQLGIFPLDQFNYLTMNAEQLRNVVNVLAKTELIQKILPIAINTGLSHEKVVEWIGYQFVSGIEDIDWKKELNILVDMYANFQTFGVTTFEGLDTNAFIKDILNNAGKTETLFEIINQALEVELLKQIAVPSGIEYASNIEGFKKLLEDADQFNAFSSLRFDMTIEDLKAVVAAIKTALPLIDFSNYPTIEVDYLNLDVAILHAVVDQIFSTLDKETQTSSLYDVVKIGLAIGLNQAQVKEIVGDALDQIDFKGINWKQEFHDIVNIYEEVQKFDLKTIENVKENYNSILHDILNDSNRLDDVLVMVHHILSLQIADKVVVPVGLDYALRQEQIRKLLEDANQLEAVEKLKGELTTDDLKQIVSAVREAANLANFKEFPDRVTADYLHLDATILRSVVNKLFSTKKMHDIVNIAVAVGVSIEKVQDITKHALDNVDFSKVEWQKEFGQLVSLYETFLTFGFESVEEFQTKNWVDIVQDILEHTDKFESANTFASQLVDLQLYQLAGTPTMQKFLDEWIDQKANEFDDIVDVSGMTSEEWKDDLKDILDIAKATNEIKVLENLNPFVYQNLDLTSDQAIANLKLIVEKALGLHLLGDNQLKNKLVLASMRQFGWIEALEEEAFQNVDWNHETLVLLSLIDTYAKLIDVEGFDIYDLSSLSQNIEQLLENDTFLDYVVEALENIVESQVVLAILPNVLDKYLVPQIEKLETIDDSALIRDILDHISSEELVNEVIQLVDVVKAVVDLNVLDIKNDGLHALALEQVDAMKTIVSGIFDSKIIQGFEGRIIRLLLKVSGLLDIEKDGDVYNQLVALDYTGEKDILLSFIDEISDVLQDESFSLFNEKNQLILDLNFWAENENAQTLVDGVKVLFGTYEDANASGSKLIEVLLPTIYDTYVEAKDIIPEDFKSIVEELDLTNASGQTLVHDLRCLVYVLDQLVAVDAQSFLTKGGNIAINDQLSDALCNIIDALHDMELFHGHEEATLSWGVNYIASLLKIELGAINEDFSNVDWQGQKAVYKNIITDIVALFKENQVTDVNAAIEIIQGILKGNHEYDTYVTDANATSILNIIDKIADVEVIDAIIPLGIKCGVKFLGEQGIQLDYIYELTNEQLVDDFRSLVTIDHKLVEDAHIVDYYLDREKGEMALPDESVVLSLVDDIYALNMVQCANGRLAEVVYDKLIALYAQDQVFELSKDDFDFRNIDWASEKEIIKALLALGYDFFETANVQTMYALTNFFKDKWYTYPTVLTDGVGYVATEALRTLQQSQLVGNIIEKGFKYIVDLANRSGKVPFSIDYLSQVSKEALMEDLGTLANILDEAISFGAMEYLRTKNIQMVDLNQAANIVEQMYDLHVVQANESELLFNAINYGLKLINDKWNDTLYVTDSQVKTIDVKQEFTLLAQIIRNAQRVLDKQDLRSITDIQAFISGDTYKKEAFYDVEMGEILSDMVVQVVDSQILQLVLVDVIDLVATQVQKVDLSFLKGTLTKEEWVEDIRTAAKLIVPAIQAELIQLVFGLDVKELPLHMDIYSEMVLVLGDLHLLNHKWADVATLATNQVLGALKVEDRVETSLFEGIRFKDEVSSLVQAIQAAQQSFENAAIVKVKDAIDIMQYKAYKDAKYANEAVVNPLLDALDALLDTQTIQAVLPTAARVGRDQLTKNNATKDFVFILDDLNQLELVQDAKLLVAYLKDAVTVGALEYVTTQDIQNLNVEKIAEMVEGLYDFHMIQKHAPNLMYELFQLATKKVVISFDVTLADFETIQYQNEFASLAEAIVAVRPLMDSLEYTSLKDVMKIVNNKDYQYKAFYKGATLDALVEFAREVLDLETVAFLLPDVFNYGVDQVKGVDVSFLKGAFTKEELVQDARQILLAVAPMDRAEIIDVIFGTKIEDISLHFNDYEEIVAAASELHILNKKWADIAALATNKILEALKSSDTVEASLFEGIVFKDEAPQLIQALEEFKAAYVASNVLTVKDILGIFKNKTYQDEATLNRNVVNAFVNGVDQAVEVKTLQVLLPTFAMHMAKFTGQKGFAMEYLFIDATTEELVADVHTLASISRELLDYGMLEFMLFGGAIDVSTADVINAAINKMQTLHCMNHNEQNLLTALFDKLGIDTTAMALSTIDYQQTWAEINEVVRIAYRIFNAKQADTLSQIKALFTKEFAQELWKVNEQTDTYLDAMIDLAKLCSESELVEAIAFPISEKYVKENNKLFDLIGIHQIYNHPQEFTADLSALATTIESIRTLDLYQIVKEDAPYPFDRSDVVETVVNHLFGLYYFNNDGRLDAVIKAVDGLVSQDLSDITADGVNLKADAPKIIEMYSYFYNITRNKYWTINSNADVKNNNFNMQLLGQASFYENALDFILTYMDTTIYEKTGPAILLVSLPLMKKFAPQYYEALDLEHLTLDVVEHDIPYLEDIVFAMKEMDLTTTIENKAYFTEQMREMVTRIFDDVVALDMLNGHMEAVLTLVAKDFINGKKIAGFEIAEDAFKFETTVFALDKEDMKLVMNELYDLFAREHINNIADAKAYIQQLMNKAGIKAFLSQEANWIMMENIMDALTRMTLVQENGLAMMNNIITPYIEQYSLTLGHASDVSMYTNEEFMEDLALATSVVKALHQLDIVSILNNQNIDYANVDAVEAILSSLADMNYFKYHMDQIIDFVDRRSILPFSIQALHASEFDFAGDMNVFAQMYKDLVPYLTSKYNPFPTYQDIRAFMNSGFNITRDMLSGTNQYRYQFVDAYDKFVQTTTYQLLLPELKEFVETKVPEKYRGVVAAVSFDGLTFEQIKEDALLSATLVRTLVDFGIIDVVKNKDIPFTGTITSTLNAQTTEMTRTEALNSIVDYLEALHCLADRSEVLLEALETLGVITNEIDLSGVNWDYEFAYLRTLITEGIDVFASCGWHTVKEVYAYIKSLNRTNIQSEIKAMARLADTDSLAVVMETLDLSDAFNQLFKPLYNRFVYHRLPVSLGELGNLDTYTVADLDEDMARVARITRAVAQMDAVPGSIKDNVSKDECIIPAQTIIEEVFALNFVDQKKQELVRFANTFVGEIDMSDLDLTGVDLASDGKVLSAYAKEILTIVAQTGLLKVKLQHVGNTELMSAVVALYQGALDTNVFKAISSWGYEKYVLPKLENANLAHRLGIDENSIEPLCQEFGVVLDALLDMGAFSNNGIDFTNTENTDRLFGVFTNVFDLSDKTMTPINKLKKNMYVLGKVDLVYPEGSLKVELKAIYRAMMKALDIITRYGDQLKTEKYELFDDQTFQNEVTALVNQAFESKVLEQISTPIADGIVRIFTKDIVEITILEHMDSQTFVNTFLPDVFNIVEKANVLGLFKKTIDYKNAQGIIDLADIAVHSTSFAPYLDQLMQYACYVVGIDIRDVDFSSVNWEMEYQGLASALREVENVLPTIDIHDKSTMKNNAFLDAVANATPHMENSTILPLVARQFAEKLSQKLFGDRFNQYINHLYQTSYTDDKLMSDYARISDILKAVVDLGYFEGGLDYNYLDPILTLAEEFFALEYTKGLEATLLHAVVKRVDALKAYTFDFDAVQDWTAEQVVLMDALKELVSLSKLMDINNVSSSALEDKAVQAQFVKVVDAMSQSIVGQQFLPQFYMDKVEPMLGNEDYRDIVDFTDPGFTPDKWASEFEKLFVAYSKLQEVGYGTSKEIALQDAKDIMVLMFGTREHQEEGLYTVTSRPQLWLTRFYNRGFFNFPNNAKVSIDTTDDRDWNDEAYQIMDVLDQMMAFETTSGSTFDYNDVYACQDETQLKEFFTTINECVAVRTAVMCIVFNVIEENTTVQQQLEASGLLDTEFQAEYDSYVNGTYVYNEAYWTDAKVQQFASIIARANAL